MLRLEITGMTPTKEVTGRLEFWEQQDYGFFTIVAGYIYDDINQRWKDNTKIYTSSVIEGDYKEGGYITTMNSYYLLGRSKHEEVPNQRWQRSRYTHNERNG